MKQVGGLWIPDGEEYLAEKLSDGSIFADHYDDDLFAHVAALSRRRVAVDVGASFGLWSRRLVGMFELVYAFEPSATARTCFEMNVSGATLYDVALGDRQGEVAVFETPGIGFKSYVKQGPGTIPMRTMDAFDLRDVDLIKVDCEGFDYFVLRGAEQTIRRERPMVIFEAKPKVSRKRYRVDQEAPHIFMDGLGYDILPELHGNFVCIPRGAA